MTRWPCLPVSLLWLMVGVTLVSGGIPDNRGTEFVIGYMANDDTDNELQLFVTTSKTTSVSVQVTAPRYSASIDEQFTVTAGTVQQIFLDRHIRTEGTRLDTKGILVTASDEVVVYGCNIETYSNDAFLAFPIDVIGDEYYAVSHYPSTYECEFMVVGVTDDTTITIQLGEHSAIEVYWDGRYYYKDDTFTVTVDRFDTLQIQTDGDLTGSYVTGDKDFSFFSGNRRTKVSPGTSKDHLVDQMLPVKTWGKKFAVVPTPHRTTGDEIKFVGSEDDTSVSVTCSGSYSQSFTLDAREQAEYIFPSDECCYVESDKAIMVILIVISQVHRTEPADPALITIPPIEQYAADYTFATPKYTYGVYRNFFMFIVKDDEKTGLKLNGAALPSGTTYTAIPNTDYVGGFIEVDDGTHTVRHDSVISVFGGVLYGMEDMETYGMLTGLRLSPINEICIPTTTPTDEGDGIDNDCDGLIDEELCTTENQGADDDGDGVAEEDCATPPPIDGDWATWSTWSTCSVSCTPASGSVTGGTWTRTRNCSDPEPKYDGLQCTGDSVETDSCTIATTCPVDGNWATWGSWGACSVTCGTGNYTRSRTCTDPAPLYGGDNCTTGDETDTGSCDSGVNCPIDGSWGSWEAWGSCSVSCGALGGTAVRSRECDSPAAAYGGANCTDNATESRTCNDVHCPIDGNWTSWSSWSSCGVTCGNSTIYRNRTCTNPEPQYSGAGCVGDDSETQGCYAGINCPIDGGFSQWSSWTSCTATCDGGRHNRSRSCTDPAPMYLGADCVGAEEEEDDCNTHSCPIDGGWTEWSDWGACSNSCGPGDYIRDRTCSNPLPQYNGTGCVGDVSEMASCVGPCTVDGGWGSWETWSSCSRTCDAGRQARARLCDNPTPTADGLSCQGHGSEVTVCNTDSCPGSSSGDAENVYVNRWPSRYFTCKSGNVICIDQEIRCDCDCEDGSDETAKWAVCAQEIIYYCEHNSVKYENDYTCVLLPYYTLKCQSRLQQATNFATSCLTFEKNKRCPSRYFTCQSGNVICIDQEFRCDCDWDCEDGSDESATWAVCAQEIIYYCQHNSVKGLTPNSCFYLSVLMALLLWYENT